MNRADDHCVFVPGGAGFIGSAVIRKFLHSTEDYMVNIDSLTYAGNLETLSEVARHERYSFSHTDIRDQDALRELFAKHQPSAVMHLAAESHVDRSIDGPSAFLETNEQIGSTRLPPGFAVTPAHEWPWKNQNT